MQEEIRNRSNKVAKESVDFIETLKQMDDTGKAAMFMMVNRLAGKANKVQESDISITINQKSISMKDYLEKHLADVDYDKAKEETDEFWHQVKNIDNK